MTTATRISSSHWPFNGSPCSSYWNTSIRIATSASTPVAASALNSQIEKPSQQHILITKSDHGPWLNKQQCILPSCCWVPTQNSGFIWEQYFRFPEPAHNKKDLRYDWQMESAKFRTPLSMATPKRSIDTTSHECWIITTPLPLEQSSDSHLTTYLST